MALNNIENIQKWKTYINSKTTSIFGFKKMEVKHLGWDGLYRIEETKPVCAPFQGN